MLNDTPFTTAAPGDQVDRPAALLLPILTSMPQIPSQYVIAIVAAAVTIVVLLALLRLRRGPEPLPYHAVESLLTPAERAFYAVLIQSIRDTPLVILAKVRLADLLVIPRGTDNHQRHRARVQSKHVDFVIAERANLRPLLVIELDDASHRRRDRAARDAFVDAALDTAGLAIWHVPCAGKYDNRVVRDEVLRRVDPSPT